MERRVLLAIFLAFLVLYVWQAAVVKPVPKPAPGAATSPPTTSAPATMPGSPVTVERSAPAATPPGQGAPATSAEREPAGAAAAATPLVAGKSEQDIRVETQHVVAVFTNRG